MTLSEYQGEGDRDPWPDDIYNAISNERRRMVLRHLDREGETTLGALSEWLASFETGKPQEQLNAQERKARYVTLYQCHIPKLEDCGLVEKAGYGSRQVVPTEKVSDVVDAMDRIDRIGDEFEKDEEDTGFIKLSNLLP